MPDSADSEKPSTLTDRVASKVLTACRTIDPTTVLRNCTRDHEGRTNVQLVGNGASCTATELAAALRELMPLSTVETVKNLLTGELDARVTVPTAQDEWDLADERARASTVAMLFRRLSLLMLLLGIGAWLALSLPPQAVANATNPDPRDI